MKTTRALALVAPVILTLSGIAHAGGSHPSYKCVGTEPFWSAEIQGGAIKVSSPDASPQGYSTRKYTLSSSESAAGMSEGVAVQVTGSRSIRGRNGATVRHKVSVSIIHAGTSGCSDGMSDETYSHHALVKEANGALLYGCCHSQ